MKFRAGHTFLFPLDHETLREHLWIIATEPNDAGAFATVCFTSLVGAKDQTVVFLRDEHPFLKKDTCVLYSQAEITSIEVLLGRVASGAARPHRDLSAAMLQLIQDGFIASDYTKNRVREFVALYRKKAKAQTA